MSRAKGKKKREKAIHPYAAKKLRQEIGRRRRFARVNRDYDAKTGGARVIQLAAVDKPQEPESPSSAVA